jgi:hypothetical protein
MHNPDCPCPKCQAARQFEWAESQLSGFGEVYGESAYESPFSEAEELELAAELLSVASEEELEQFLGKLFKSAWKGIKKVGSFVGKVAKPLGGVLRGVAKAAMPFVGGALGSFIPIPGVGTAIGSALGGALGKALELEYGQMQPEDRELEMARRFVRLAGDAARLAAQADPSGDPQQEAETAILNAARRQVPNLPSLPGMSQASAGMRGRRLSGRWIRRGNSIVVIGT